MKQKATFPITPATSAAPVTPANAVAATPTAPAASIAPTTSATPAASITPATPVTPATPATSVTPATPAVPTARPAGRLVVCPTPLGNLGDMTDRARAALESADVVCAEDTRVTGRLLAALGIGKRLERLDEAMLSTGALDAVVGRAAAGEVIAYCSDAGMPGVSDPGLRLVRAAQDAGVPVEVLPGPSAAATAYVASGCTCPRYYFGGFFPRKDAERAALLESVRSLDAALVFYESPNRLIGALDALAAAFPLREAAVCRELTKLHEEVVRSALPELRDRFRERAQAEGVKGEIVLVVGGPSKAEGDAAAKSAQDAARIRAAELKAAGMRGKDVARALADEFGIARNAAYDIALEA